MVKDATHAPLDVCMVAYHTSAIWTSVEPKSVMHWLIRKRMERFFQLMRCLFFMDVSLFLFRGSKDKALCRISELSQPFFFYKAKLYQSLAMA